MAAAHREVWTGAQLRRLLAEKAGLELSAASVSALLTSQPSQIKLGTLAALCAALDCTPNDLLELDTATPANAASPSDQTSADRDSRPSVRPSEHTGDGRLRTHGGAHTPPPF